MKLKKSCRGRKENGLLFMSLGNSLFNAPKKMELDETLPDIWQSKKLSTMYHLTLDEFIDFEIDLI